MRAGQLRRALVAAAALVADSSSFTTAFKCPQKRLRTQNKNQRAEARSIRSILPANGPPFSQRRASSIKSEQRQEPPPASLSPLFSAASYRASLLRNLELSVETSVAQLSQGTEASLKQSRLVEWYTRTLLTCFMISMCVVLPITLAPLCLWYQLRVSFLQFWLRISSASSTAKQQKLRQLELQKEVGAVASTRVVARILLALFPFCHYQVTTNETKASRQNTRDENNGSSSSPAIWVCNHISMLDVFLLLATDHLIRGNGSGKLRPIKIIYWKQLENNFVTKLMFTMSGFIAVDMVANAPGEQNEYDMKSFKAMVKSVQQAVREGFDIGILPEGQLNPTPEKGLLPVYTGAYTLAKMNASRRQESTQALPLPIHMVALYNLNNIWHPIRGWICQSRQVAIRSYFYDDHDGSTMPPTAVVEVPQRFASPSHFNETFHETVGYFGQYGRDNPALLEKG
jgi:1-acyl-sn-glycerol-3-phosphate acyltransferase